MDHLRDQNGPQGGIPFAKATMLQSQACLYQLEQLMLKHPVEQVIELGTYSGALSVFFGLHCPDRVDTVDIEDDKITAHTRLLFDCLGVRFHKLDVLQPATLGFLAGLRTGRCLWFIDAGPKPVRHDSWERYVPVAERNDLVVMHDVGLEFVMGEKEVAIEEKYHLLRWKPEEQKADKTTLGIWWVR